MSKEAKSGSVFMEGSPPRVSVEDIAEQKTHLKKLNISSKSLKNNEDLLFSLFDYICDGIVILDTTGKVIGTNPVYCLMLGYSKGEVIGTPISKYIHPDRLKDLERFQEQIETNRKVSLESVAIRKDGTSIPIEVRGVSCTYLGQQTLFGVVRDISEQKQDTDKLRAINEELKRRVLERTKRLKEANKLLEGTFSSLTEAIFMIDPSMRKIIFCNQAVKKIFGYTKEEVIGRNTEFLHVDHAHYEEFGRKMTSALDAEGVFNTDFDFKRKNNEIVSTESTVTEIRDEMGQVIANIGVIRDVTQRIKTLSSLRLSKEDLCILSGRLIANQEEERSRLARELHDDFIQRLAVVAVQLRKLEQGVPFSSSPAEQRIKEIREQVVQLSNDLHDISRRLHPSILDDLGLSASIESECAGFSEREGIPVEYKSKGLPPELPKEVALCIYRIVQEGLRNISMHAKADEASVSLTGSDDLIVLSIQDRDIGFDPSEIKKKGSLGLTSITERVRMLEGRLSIQSQQGEGTLIQVRLHLMRRTNAPIPYIVSR
ncbi:PAS domain S-box protein [Nitrospira defluvii]|nr:PAS domain S-box protein [Nitrospira defluvii]